MKLALCIFLSFAYYIQAQLLPPIISNNWFSTREIGVSRTNVVNINWVASFSDAIAFPTNNSSNGFYYGSDISYQLFITTNWIVSTNNLLGKEPDYTNGRIYADGYHLNGTIYSLTNWAMNPYTIYFMRVIATCPNCENSDPTPDLRLIYLPFKISSPNDFYFRSTNGYIAFMHYSLTNGAKLLVRNTDRTNTLEWSTNLIKWNVLTNYYNSNTVKTYVWDREAKGPMRMYRVRPK